ncbi:type II restriction endonuclease [Clostridium perfringens]|nr:type II restriction endonuclease [Clostridium perfringens]
MNFIKKFHEKVLEHDIDWDVKGLITVNNQIISLGSDSKLIGRIFELISNPLMREIAEENGFKLEIPDSQTTYPDFTLSKYKKDGSVKERIAVDIKTTYKKYNAKKEPSKIGFTLGSYGSFIRNNTKNILFPYNTYDSHYVVGFLYDRVDDAKEGDIYDENDDVIVPYTNVEYFVQEKHKIAGEKPGSGNTENIGSIASNNIDDYVEGNGIFSLLGEEIFNDYWRNYPKNRAQNKEFTNIKEYIEWKRNNGYDVSELEKLLNND